LNTNIHTITPNIYIGGGVCIKGNIYTRQKCPVCGKKMEHNERKGGCFCCTHKKVSATRFYVRFDKVFKNFTSYVEASQFLNGLRYKSVEGTFDAKDYRKDKPYGFLTLAEKYLKRKEKRKSYVQIKRYMKVAGDYFAQRNVKEITGADVEDYLFSIPDISEKTRANYKTQLHDFWQWILQRGIINIAQMPIFPKIDYELGFRKITNWETQDAIIAEVARLADKTTPKIAFGIELLATYTALRPDDLRRITEADFDEKYGMLIIHNPTKVKNKFKTVRLVEEHAQRWLELRNMYRGLPHMKYFRHQAGVSGATPEAPFGQNVFYNWWKRACKSLGIEDLDLYGGTRHTTTTEIARAAGTDNAKKASGHETNKAFDRYCQTQDGTAFEMSKMVVKKKRKTVVKLEKKK